MDRIVVADAADLATAAADLVEAEIAGYPGLLLGLAGGSTPVATHVELAERSIDWSGVTAWITDERWVPADSEESNQRMARSTLTDVVGVDLVAPDTRSSNPARAAQAYADLVVPMVTDPDTRSVVMLGIGPDGHTASLFPGTKALDTRGASYVANFVPRLDMWRLTATFGLLAAADVVVFLVSGGAKAQVVAAIAEGADYPAGRVTAGERVLWLLDREAAGLLPR